jgi:hypothetical protein
LAVAGLKRHIHEEDLILDNVYQVARLSSAMQKVCQIQLSGALSRTLVAICVFATSACTLAPFGELRIRGVTSQVSTPFKQTWDFDPAQTSSYAYNSSKVDFTGGVCRLKRTDQVDDSNDCSGFGDGLTINCGGSFTGVAWDGTNHFVRLSQIGTPTNTAELDPSWTPKYSNIVGYWKLNGALGVLPNGTGIPFAVGTAGTVFNPDSLGMSYVDGQLNQGATFSGSSERFPSGMFWIRPSRAQVKSSRFRPGLSTILRMDTAKSSRNTLEDPSGRISANSNSRSKRINSLSIISMALVPRASAP